MTTRQDPSPVPYPHLQSPLSACLIALAGTPDDASWVECQLVTIAQLSADLITPIAYSSVTAYRDDAITTVATDSEIARAVDQAQYDEQDGPCLAALDTASPVAVPDVTATMRWPGFRDTAYRLGIRASLSIPLFAGRGTAMAALNLYGRDATDLAPLTAAVWATYDPHDPCPRAHPHGLDHGGEALVAGLAGAFAVRARIQQAIGVIMAITHRAPDAAYLILRIRAAEAGTTLADAATAVMEEQRW
ncbi:GAF and ANTAR domain-containing protein [Couchioplanes azureus]|uniref:GAF and ANTAR domain-containing protein n=1 Tax=Couchioplanes caeruleus TaxID=56438 RepID=UPI001671196C|nr:GAF and ANTAR domain-containing protein [Couchioplanes caeruleus]GGQ71571.1 transcriptional regulator [Couchioplanes caeruleus subsp. azureus]